MRLLLPLAAALLLTACATAPQRPEPTTPRPQTLPIQRGDLLGETIEELGARFGQPSFQVREGPGLKLQWSTSACVLDTFLYAAPGNSVMRVTYVDARRPSGEPTDRANCIGSIATR
jgi:outer membrane biogenesis lipoprotein LolB